MRSPPRLKKNRAASTVIEAADRLDQLERELAVLTAALAEALRQRDNWHEQNDMALTSLAQAQRNEAAIRELMNVYNLGGWTDAEGPMKRALAAEAIVARCNKALYERGLVGLPEAFVIYDDALARAESLSAALDAAGRRETVIERELSDLKDALDAERLDAERYRWCGDNWHRALDIIDKAYHEHLPTWSREATIAIDAARLPAKESR